MFVVKAILVYIYIEIPFIWYIISNYISSTTTCSFFINC